MLLTNLTRKQAFLTHLSVSLIVFLMILGLIVIYWYPSFFLTLDGGDRGIVTIFLVDVVLGPGMTLLIYKQGKPGLKFDLAVIMTIQLAALVWGVSKVYEDRSAAAVFYLGKFNCLGVTYASEIDPEIREGRVSAQKLAILRRPDTRTEYSSMLNEAMQAGKSEIYHFGSLFESINEPSVERIRTYKLDLSDVRKENPSVADAIEDYISVHDGYGESYGLYPLSCRFGDAIAVFDYDNRMISDWFDGFTGNSLIRAESSIPLR